MPAAPRFTRAGFLQNIKERWPDFVVMILLWIGSATVNDGSVPDTFFLERDPALSYPKATAAGTEVPNWAIYFMGLAVVQIIIWTAQAVAYFSPHTDILYRSQRHASLVVDPGYSLLTLAETMALTFFLCNSMKAFAARPRPCFFAQCNYKGYADALKTGDFTAYIGATVAGVPGSMANCLIQDPAVLKDAHMSWPSSHSAWAFSGFGFLSIFLFWITASARVGTRSQLWKLFAAFPPLLAAGLIAITRALDHYHDWTDIVTGSILGFSIALFIFWLHYPPPPPVHGNDEEESKLMELPATVAPAAAATSL